MNEKEKNEIVAEVLKIINSPVELKIECINGAELPFYSHSSDVGLDIRANEDVEVLPMQTVMIKTGLKMIIPEGYEIQIRGRSGLNAKTPFKVALGTIDPGFRDELRVVATNYSPIGSSNVCTLEDKNKFGIYKIKRGERVAQIVFAKFVEAKVISCENVNEAPGDRNGGFGSSGIK